MHRDIHIPLVELEGLAAAATAVSVDDDGESDPALRGSMKDSDENRTIRGMRNEVTFTFIVSLKLPLLPLCLQLRLLMMMYSLLCLSPGY